MPRNYRRKRRRNRSYRRKRRTGPSNFGRALQRTSATTYHPDDVRAFPYEDYYNRKGKHPAKASPGGDWVKSHRNSNKKGSIAAQNFINSLPPETQALINQVPTSLQSSIMDYMPNTQTFTQNQYLQAATGFLAQQGINAAGATRDLGVAEGLHQIGQGLLTHNPLLIAQGTAYLLPMVGREAIPLLQRAGQVALATAAAVPARQPQQSNLQYAMATIANLAQSGVTSALTSINNQPAPGTTNLERGITN